MSEKSNQTKKIIILFSTFIVPLLFFLFLASGKVNFNKLPTITEKVSNLNGEIPFRNKVSVLSVLGEEPSVGTYQNILNLYQVIYKSTEKYKNFQVITVIPKSGEDTAEELKKELAKVGGVDLPKWEYLVLSENQIKNLVSSFGIPAIIYDKKKGLEKVFIIDEDMSLRGRTDDEDTSSGLLYSYDTRSVSVLKNKLREDLKVVFYESKFAVKEPKLN
ncbi:hypothetical protein [Flavicella sp.]|uniref:hypothetical protein n=1 Tax=Flavicella sp. TaxID=2957742 RepID=UPI0026389EA3|nr:hypothetical protein [Flavicella sp.]MDG1805623.1 hypothetical protein [Flavicella sp.]